MEYTTKSEAETEKIAQKIAKSLKPGDVLALSGDLGSGKTVFVKGLAKAFGIKDCITSPTFVLVKEYPIRKSQITNRKSQINFNSQKSKSKKLEAKSYKLKADGKLVHVDCYRMKDENDAESVGLGEYMNDNQSITAIEWPERISSILPKKTIKINFINLGKNIRKISIN